MSAAIAIIWLVVFIIGVGVGVMAVIALSVVRKGPDGHDGPPGPDDLVDNRWPERDHGASGIAGHWTGTGYGPGDDRPYGPGDDRPYGPGDDRPRWPDAPEAPDDEGTS
jgi:hypothetical protein